MTQLEMRRWPCFLARCCDYCLFYLALGALALSLPYFYGSTFYMVLFGCTPVLWLPIEAGLLRRGARTPGQVLFGLSKQGRLTYLQALKQALCYIKHPPISRKRALVGSLISVVCALAIFYENGGAVWTLGRGDLSGWVQYSSSAVGFKVAFPQEPHEVSKELSLPDSNHILNYQEIATQQTSQARYSVSHLSLPGKWRWAGTTTLLKGVLNLLLKNEPDTALLSKEFKSYAGLRVLDYHMQKGEEQMRGRLIIAGNTLYKLTVTYPALQGELEDVTAFLDSFAVS